MNNGKKFKKRTKNYFKKITVKKNLNKKTVKILKKKTAKKYLKKITVKINLNENFRKITINTNVNKVESKDPPKKI